MAAAGVDWQHHILGGARHGFIQTRATVAYHAHSARRSWRAVIALFEEVTAAG